MSRFSKHTCNSCGLVLLTFLFIACAEVQINLSVDYTEQGNYNTMKLTCRDGLGAVWNDAVFLKRVPGQENSVALSDSTMNDGEITITLTQAEEGYFSCHNPSGGGTSREVGLAGMYNANCKYNWSVL